MRFLRLAVLGFGLLAFDLASNSQVTAITHARLIDGTGAAPVEDATILIEGRTIKAIGDAALKVPTGARILDAQGQSVLPGLADLHVHLVGGWDGENTDILGYQNYMNALLYAGVTTVLDTGNVPPFVLQLRAAIANGQVLGPRIYCVGPLIDGADPVWGPISVALTSRSQVPKVVSQLAAEKVDLVKLYAGLSDLQVQEMSAEAKKHDLRTVIDQWSRNGSMDLMNEGISGFAHLPFDRISDDAVKLARDKKIFFLSTLAVQESFLGRRLRDLRFVDDPLIADTMPSSQRKALLTESQEPIKPEDQQRYDAALAKFQSAESNVKRLWDAGVLIAAGTDAPYPGDSQGEGLHRELELLVESGLTPMQAIQAATRNAALVLHAESEWGTLEPGKLANMILVHGHPDQEISQSRRITAVIKEGRVLDRDKLKFSSTSIDFPVLVNVSTP